METVSLAGAYCVFYQEVFTRGDTHTGSYILNLELSDPDGFTMYAGGPASAFVVPAAREHGTPPVAASTVLYEAEGVSPADSSTESVGFGASGAVLSPALAAMLGQSLIIERAGGDVGPDKFEDAVKAHLQEIYSTPTGRNLLDSLHASGKATTIQYAFDGFNRAAIPKDDARKNQCFYQDDGTTPGTGVGITVGYHPGRDVIGDEAWAKRPAAIGLAHELIHAEQAAHGRMRKGKADNPGRVSQLDATKPAQAPILELETVGVPPHDEYHATENKIRAEWATPQPQRAMY